MIQGSEENVNLSIRRRNRRVVSILINPWRRNFIYSFKFWTVVDMIWYSTSLSLETFSKMKQKIERIKQFRFQELK